MTVGTDSNSEGLLNRFLLEQLSEDERAQVEERLLADKDFFEAALSAESALMDQYVQGLLTGDKLKGARKLFESSSFQRRELSFTRGLAAAVRENELVAGARAANNAGPRETKISLGSWLAHPRRLIWAITMLLCVSLLGWVMYLYSTRRSLEAQQSAALRSSEETRQKLEEQLRANAELKRQLETEAERRAMAEDLIVRLQSRVSTPIASVLLAPADGKRGGPSETVVLKPTSREFQLHLQLDDPELYTRYTVTITTVAGSFVWSTSLSAERVRRNRITLLLPAKLFKHEDYKIELTGETADQGSVSVADYTFNVRK